MDTHHADRWRVYYAARDGANRSHVFFVDVAPGDPERILGQSDGPVLGPGEPGTFDERGVMPSSVVALGGKKLLYYTGWGFGDGVPYHNAVGLAVSEDGGRSFRRIGPVLREPAPRFTGTPCVLVENGLWRGWYLSCTTWDRGEPRYRLAYAESRDGLHWSNLGVALDYRSESEGGICRPTVLREGGLYRMWFCHRGARDYRGNGAGAYRIGYAESEDGILWLRRDSVLEASPGEWDGAMTAYPWVVPHGGCYFLFYNGNGFGKAGFGYAVGRD